MDVILNHNEKVNTVSTPDCRICKTSVSSVWLIGTLVCVSMALFGCSAVETNNAAQNGSVEPDYVASNADFSKYERLQIDDLGIFFPQNSFTPPEEIQRIREVFQIALVAALQSYALVETSGPGTLVVQATLIDFRNPGEGGLTGVREELRDIASKGELLFMMELRDSESNAVLARVADSSQTPTFATSESVATDWDSVDEAAQNWAALFRRFLDQNLGG